MTDDKVAVGDYFKKCLQYLEKILPCLLDDGFEFYDDTYLPLLIDSIDQMTNNSNVGQHQSMNEIMDKFLDTIEQSKELSATAQVIGVHISKLRNNSQCILAILSHINLWSHIYYDAATGAYADKLIFYTREHFNTIALEQEVLSYLATCFGCRLPPSINDLSAKAAIAAMRNITRDFSSCSLGLRRCSADYLTAIGNDSQNVIKFELLLRIYEELLTSLKSHLTNDMCLHSIISLRILCGGGLFHVIEEKLVAAGINPDQKPEIIKIKDEIAKKRYSKEINDLLKTAYQPPRSLEIDSLSPMRSVEDIIDDCRRTLSDIHLCLYPENTDTYDSTRAIDCCE